MSVYYNGEDVRQGYCRSGMPVPDMRNPRLGLPLLVKKLTLFPLAKLWVCPKLDALQSWSWSALVDPFFPVSTFI